jgi:sodium-dependent dicarboxylate transporter 2/3/5
MLGVAYSASIGGLGTLVGTPTNMLLARFAAEHGLEISFARWMWFSIPLAGVFLYLAWLTLTRVAFPIRLRDMPGGRALIRRELAALGPVSRGEWIVLAVFVLIALAWVLREPLTKWPALLEVVPWLANLDDSLIGLAGAIALFLIPVDLKKGVFALDWPTAAAIPWGILLLFGGGFCLADAMDKTELSAWFGERVRYFQHSPPLVLVVVATTLVVFLTELTSNTPTAAALLPVLHEVARGIDMHPLLLLVPASLAASCAFMLPVGTPPNAIVFGSGYIQIRQMVRGGLLLNLIGIVLIPLWMYLFGRWAFGLGSGAL